jgi:hypothetical protein
MERVTRRGFVAGGAGAVGAAALAAGCGGSSEPTRALPRVSERRWRQLERGLRGKLIRGGPAYGFLGEGIQSNLINISTPQAIVLCAAPSDVAFAIRWSREQQMPFAIRGGGHSFGGYSGTKGLQISVDGLRTLSIDHATGRVEVGTGWSAGPLVSELLRHGLILPTGTCPPVGIGGLTLVGGYGPYARMYGMTTDRLTGTTAADADGRMITADANTNPDLFWAMRGGGGGTFAANTSFTFQAAEAPTEVAVAIVSWESEGADELLAELQGVLVNGPRTLSGTVGAFPAAPRGASTGLLARINLQLMSHGSVRDLEERLVPALKLGTPFLRVIESVPFPTARRLFFAQGAPLVNEIASTQYVETKLPPEGITTMVDRIQHFPGSSSPDKATATLVLLGGAVNDLAPGATAYVHRNAQMIWTLFAGWALDETNDLIGQRVRAWKQDFASAMQPYTLPQSYQGLIDPTLRDWAKRYFGSNLPRLIKAKRRYDPGDVFRNPQSVPTSA